MSDKKFILVKAILDKTGITKGVKEIQAVLNRTHLSLHTKFDTRDAEKLLFHQSAPDKVLHRKRWFDPAVR